MVAQAKISNPMDARTVIAAALVVSALGALFYNVLPIYVGAAQDYKGLDNRAVGFLTTAYFIGFNVVTISAFFWIRQVSWTFVVAIAAPIAALSMSASALVEGYVPLLLLTAIAGGGFAALYGVGTTILADVSNPASWFGVKIAVEALPGVLLLLVLPGTAIAKWGFAGAVFGIVVLLIFLSPFLFWIPARGRSAAPAQIATGHTGSRQSPWIWASLAAITLFFGGASAVWAFLERIAAAGGFSADAVGVLLSVTLVFAVLGSLLSAALAGRFGNVWPFAASALLFAMSLLLLNEPATFAHYVIGACGATFTFAFMIPNSVTEVAELDTDGRFVILTVPAIGLGAMFGPAIGGTLSQSGEFGGLLIFGAVAMLLASILLVAGARNTRRQTDPHDLLETN